MSDAAIRVSEAAFLIAGDRVADMLDFLLPGSGDDFRDDCTSCHSPCAVSEWKAPLNGDDAE